MNGVLPRRMVKLALLAAWGGLGTAGLWAAPLDFTFAPAREINGKPLQKAAEAEVRWLFFTVCEGALYTSDGSASAWPDLQAPLAIELAYHRDVSAEALRDMTERHWQRVLTEEQRMAIADDWAYFQAYLPALAKGDRCALLYRPGTGVTLLHNDTPLVTVVDLEFARHFIGLYLGADPLNEDFRDGLLGP